MTDVSRKHPDRDTLLKFASGKAPDWEISAIEQHINQCDQCSNELAKVCVKEDPLVGQLQEMQRAKEAMESSATGNYDTLNFSASPVVAPAAEVTPESNPQSIGRYRLEKILGQGSFGLVYLARDDMLQRLVAIKVPHERLVADPTQAEAYLAEARTVASLDHPHIVPVHDVGQTEQYPCFVVSKYIDGTDLTAKLKSTRLTLREAVELVAIVAEALHHAHRQGLVHRDIKPGNILLDRSGKPFVADFGLALREEDSGKGPRFAGTPAYMSPEQARGEGHRVDARSDVFSLGVVFYQLLVGRLPFRAVKVEELLEQITALEPRPPRQHDDSIPKELDRICLKALSKRASERYSTAQDMAEDLRHFLTQTNSPNQATTASVASIDTKLQTLIPAGWSGSFVAPVIPPVAAPVKIVPKGLRSFDAHDADFFLELLPGPRDQEGLPDSIRFWKSRIEETDPDLTFPVGLIYGPSGCGKSSLVKAGLLPKLSNAVIPVYLEATATETETRLLNGLRKRCPDLAPNLGLKESIAALRRGNGLPAGKKVVVILDQFEQWLHAKKQEKLPELVQALRQCDGGRVQCIVMVRDDFWLAVSRFLRDLEIRLLEGENSALADLFDLDHAKKVLAAFGRAFGRFTSTNKDNEEFLKQAVAGLSEEGKVICVRLALFAEMMKGYAWTPTTLREVGGTEGVGITFLEETFSASTAPPHHRLHQQAARSVLKALLPDSGTDIKGHMLSQAELLEASGYAGRPADFEDLIRMLDGEIRLITPTDLEGRDGFEGDRSSVQAEEKYYQLTHDYLVPSIRAWSTRKQKESRRGRAELMLADRASIWYGRRENRQLPSMVQSMQILWWTNRKTWSYPEHKMMSRAVKYYTSRGAIILVVLLLLGLGSRDVLGRWEGQRLRNRLLESTLADVPDIVQEMGRYRRWVDPLVREARKQAEAGQNPRRMLHSSLALLPVDNQQVDYLYERLLHADPEELVVIRKALFDAGADVSSRLWTLLLEPQNDQNQRFRAACALSLFAPEDPRWEKVSHDVASILITQKRFVIAQWTQAFTGVGRWLIVPLADFLQDEEHKVSDLGVMSSIYATYARDLPQAYALLERRLSEAVAADTSPGAKIAAARKQSRIGTALLAMGQATPVWPLLKQTSDATVRSFLIDQLGSGGVDPKLLLTALDAKHEASVKRALVLSLGEFGVDHLSLAERRNYVPQLARIYREEPDAGIHGAVEWLLRQWQAGAELQKIDEQLATGRVENQRQWYRNRQGHTLVVIPKPGEFSMGDEDQPRRVRIDRTWAVAAQEVTVEQYRRFRKNHEYGTQYAPTNDCPVHNVTWFDAAAYCNWLSEQEKIPESQWCYVPNKDGKYDPGMSMAADFLTRAGYRLPTEAEWEYACRAGSSTPYAWGRSEDVLVKYAWIITNSQARSHPVGSLKPNDLGLFDMHGNEWEWCQDVYTKLDDSPSATQVINDTGSGSELNINHSRVLRGGAFGVRPSNIRSTFRYDLVPTNRNFFNGFRVARTISSPST